LNDLADNLAAFARNRFQVKPAAAKEFGEEAAAFIADHWGGQLVYVPKDMAGRICSRDTKIYAEFVGDNQAELARKYGMSFQHVCRILKKEREKRRVKQHQLPI
jgi:Mor family transcriptional regulator